MITVEVSPMPQANFDHIAKFPNPRFLPYMRPKNVFSDGEITPDDRELALALWRELDLGSRRWYCYWFTYRDTPDHVFAFAGMPLSPDDCELLNEESR